MKKTRLNRRSPKHRAANDEAARARAKYLLDFPNCAICSVHADTIEALSGRLRWLDQATEVHHLCGRNAKAKDKTRYERPQNYLCLCKNCHRFVTLDSRLSAWICWAAKLFTDPDTADLDYLRTTKPTRFGKVIE